MENGYSDCEIVRVVSEARLVDCHARSCAYWRRDGRPLPQGWYVVSWPPPLETGARRFNEDAIFRGPFALESGARRALLRMKAERLPVIPGAALDDELGLRGGARRELRQGT